RILTGSAGPAYRTRTQLELRHDHAAAVDAVQTELDLPRDLGEGFIRTWGLFELTTRASSKSEFLLRPDLGRRLTEEARRRILIECHSGNDLQVVVGDGLSVLAVASQVPALLPLLEENAKRRGW